jgi:D-3-phosphoglycerate dehydrogenase
MVKILISDPLSEKALKILKKEKNIKPEMKTELSRKELLSCIKNYQALIVRSRTQVTKELIEAGKNLKVIGRAGVGVDNIDIEAATKKGITVINTPDANTISTTELTMAMILALSRNIYAATLSLKNNRWSKDNLTGVELYDKVLAIIGLGRIGSQVAKRAVSFGMHVVAYDPFVSKEEAVKKGAKLMPLKEIISTADYISIHTSLTNETYHLIGEKEFRKMKNGVRIINCARGGIIDEKALYKALVKGKVAGCALDVFENEPPDKGPLFDLDQVIVTPHIGAVTHEAKSNVAVQIAQSVMNTLKGEILQNAVNFPHLEPEMLELIRPYINLAEKLGKFQSQTFPGCLKRVRITYTGEMNNYQIKPITVALLKGLLEGAFSERVNYINAPVLAKERGIRVIEAKSNQIEDFANLIKVETETSKYSGSVAGTLFGNEDSRIVRINNNHVDAVPEGYLLVCSNRDRPGAIAHISKVLSRNNINIASMTVGRKKIGGRAVTVLNVDNYISEGILKKIKSNPIIIEARLVEL